MSVGLSLGERRWRLIRRVDTIKAWFADTGRDGLYVDGQAGGALFQDAGRTQPAAIGDPVGGPADLSGNGYHGYQETPAARPLRTVDGLAFDAVDDRLKFGDVLRFGTASFTMLVLCATTDRARRQSPLGKRASIPSASSPGYAMTIMEDGRLALGIDDGVNTFYLAAHYTTGSDTNGFGQHVHVLAVDRGAGIVYGRRDGAAIGQADISAFGDISGTTSLQLGGMGPEYPYDGTIRAVVVMAGTDYQVVENALLARLP